MKKTILTLVTILTTTINVFSQNNIWVKIPNYELKRTEVLNITSGLNITEIKQAFPSSRNSELQQVYEITCNCDENDLLNEVIKRKDIFINPEIGPKYETLSSPNDYSLSVPYDYALELISASLAWDITTGDSSILISITDAGYIMDNYELYTKVVSSNLNFSQTNPTHGTAVATTAAGSTNNGFGKSSVGYNTSLDLRSMSYNSLLEATYLGARVINASWAASCTFSSYAQQVINEVYNNGSVVVAAAGNGSTCGGAANLVYPASYENVISVTSVGPSDNHERFLGNPTSTHQHNNMVDICAPGYDVFVTTTNGNFLPGNGTSFAAPYVSGTIALMLSVNPCLTPNQISTILKSTADTSLFLVNQQYEGLLGSGRLNAFKAVQAAKKFNTMSANVSEMVDCTNFTKQLTVSNLSGEFPHTIEWSNGDLGENCYVMYESGLYDVSITDADGCLFYQEMEVVPYSEIVATLEVKDVSCYGGNDGSVSFNVIGGKPGYTFEWMAGTDYWGPSSDTTINNLSSDIYSLIITDSYLCNKEVMVVIQEPLQLTSSINVDIETQTIDLIVNGGTEPYSYQWYSQSGGFTTEDLENITPGFYEVLITDTNGCMISNNVFVNEQNTSSINELTTGEFLMYPNPSNGNVTIKTGKDNDCNLLITNINGQNVVVNKTFNGETIVSELSEGLYLVTINNTTQKLVVK